MHGCTEPHEYDVKNEAKHINDPRCLHIEATVRFYEVIHAPMPRKLVGNRSCIMPGLPRHLVQELNVGTSNPKAGGNSLFFSNSFKISFCNKDTIDSPSQRHTLVQRPRQTFNDDYAETRSLR